jgi:hypothetical protein
MASALLVDEQIEAGKALLGALDRSEARVTTAFWLYESDSGSWKLVLAMPIIDTEGTQAAYRAINTALTEVQSKLLLRDIEVTSPKDERVVAIRRAYRTGPVIGSIRLTNNIVNGTLIEDALVYRSM